MTSLVTTEGAAIYQEDRRGWTASFASGMARAISEICAPPFVLLALVIMTTRKSNPGVDWRHAAIYLVFSLLLPLSALIVLRVRGSLSDLHLNRRRERIIPFLWSVVGAAVGWTILRSTGAPRELDWIATSHLTSALLLFLVTLQWKVSVHAATIAGAAVVFSLHFHYPTVVVLGAILGVCWARVHMGRHTIAQTVFGASIGALAFLFFSS